MSAFTVAIALCFGVHLRSETASQKMAISGVLAVAASLHSTALTKHILKQDFILLKRKKTGE